MEKFTCIIVDDVEIDRLTVHSYVKKFSSFEILGVFASSREALLAIETNKVDVIFLDIDMPNFNGIDLRKKALEIPVCVFITSHPEYVTMVQADCAAGDGSQAPKLAEQLIGNRAGRG